MPFNLFNALVGNTSRDGGNDENFVAGVFEVSFRCANSGKVEITEALGWGIVRLWIRLVKYR